MMNTTAIAWSTTIRILCVILRKKMKCKSLEVITCIIILRENTHVHRSLNPKIRKILVLIIRKQWLLQALRAAIDVFFLTCVWASAQAKFLNELSNWTFVRTLNEIFRVHGVQANKLEFQVQTVDKYSVKSSRNIGTYPRTYWQYRNLTLSTVRDSAKFRV
jgi:hypothetical protein